MKKLLLGTSIALTLLVLTTTATTAIPLQVITTVWLWAGQTIHVGTVTVGILGDNLVVTYTITDCDWTLDETHLYVGIDPPSTSSPGKFPYKIPDVASDKSHQYSIPLSDLGAGCGDTLYIAAHATVLKIIGWDDCIPIYQDETAWGWCDLIQNGAIPFSKGWAKYFSVTIPCVHEPPCES